MKFLRTLPVVIPLLAGCGAGLAPSVRPEALPGASARVSGPPGGVAAPAADEMLDVEAWLDLEVPSVVDAARDLRAAVAGAGGTLVKDEVARASGRETGHFDARVPAAAAGALLEQLAALGRVRSRNVSARDVSREYHDAGIVLHNLEATLARYEALLAAAKDVKDMLEIERELTRVRTEIDRVTGERRFLEDRVARSTLHVTLEPVPPVFSAEFTPQAKLHPGLRAVHLLELPGGGRTRSSVGVGLSALGSRALSFDLDLFKRPGESALAGAQAVFLTVGGEMYSDFLGRGARTVLNPYLGARTGWAQVDGAGRFVLAATFGIELFHTDFVLVGAETRVSGLFGAKGSELAFDSAVQLNLAF